MAKGLPHVLPERVNHWQNVRKIHRNLPDHYLLFFMLCRLHQLAKAHAHSARIQKLIKTGLASMLRLLPNL